jgi:hypothetical protein
LRRDSNFCPGDPLVRSIHAPIMGAAAASMKTIAGDWVRHESGEQPRKSFLRKSPFSPSRGLHHVAHCRTVRGRRQAIPWLVAGDSVIFRQFVDCDGGSRAAGGRGQPSFDGTENPIVFHVEGTQIDVAPTQTVENPIAPILAYRPVSRLRHSPCEALPP